MTSRLPVYVSCENTRRCLLAALDGGWEWVGYTRGGHIEIRWPATDARLHCGTTPSGNSWKSFARDVEQVSGVVVWRKGNRRRSRKSPRVADEQVAASRRRWAQQQERQWAAARAAELRERARIRSAQVAAEDDRRRRDIEALMRPGRGW